MTSLYKKDSKGKIRVLNIYTEGADLVQSAGLLDGNLVTNRKTCKPKNLGKSNESTAEEQAISEMQSKIVEKLKEDYFTTIEAAETTAVILPMLAKDYKDYDHKINWNSDAVYVQPKLDGMRALAVCGSNASLTSRTGSPIDTCEHIIEELRKLPEGLILDGELYAHGKSFQDNMRLIKKYRPNETELVKFHNYDLVSDDAFSERLNVITQGWDIQREHIELVDTMKISTQEQLAVAHALNINEGFEGSIVRWGSESYKVNARSENLLKYKDFKDIALPIIDIVPSDARPEWGQPVYELNGRRFSSGMKFSHDERKHWLMFKDNYIGRTAEIRFFEYTDDGLPRFPVTVGIRIDK
jgi:ATP-dependent DNA ligase